MKVDTDDYSCIRNIEANMTDILSIFKIGPNMYTFRNVSDIDENTNCSMYRKKLVLFV
mgnify:CR=1 FL=1